ncbi:MFS transporter [Francisella philomiragia]|uniref:MFS transporter n=1 Tax=Francisella philomiragia TaxID=28110 RepID=UPI001908F3CD|nr:MFS transporter [Francisella philomiragia]MBK2268310.1 MFS transporter [Francisella philomiragia]MBK2279695.1 MFS transporter [Francisella philomiragia]MBK2287621.1 MFS transporter [Francisella philomiragia]MBK2289600.1 MFS transporter [Francisella philomiragia]MBK2291498.1 MFS transporter [Francisella philomiragia]
MTTKSSDNSLFKNYSFISLFTVQFLSALNSNAVKTTLLFYLTYISSEDGNLLISISTAFFILPFFLFSALAGQVADKFNKAYVLRGIKLYGLIIVILFSTCFYLQQSYLLTLVIFMVGIESAFVGPIKYSLLPEIVPDEKLLPANSLVESLTFLAILVGTLFGSVFLGNVYGNYIIIITLISIASIAFITSFFVSTDCDGDREIKVMINIFASTFSLAKYCYNHKKSWNLIILISWFWALGIVILTEIVPYVKYSVHGKESVATLFLILFSIGISIGTYSCTKLVKKFKSDKVVFYSGILISVALMLLSISSYLQIQSTKEVSLLALVFDVRSWLIIFSFLLIAIFSGIYTIPLYTALQHTKDKSYLSRIISVNNIMNALFMVLGTGFIFVINLLEIDFVYMFLIMAVFNLVFIILNKKKIVLS